MEPNSDGGRARRQQRAVRTRIGAAAAAGIGFGAAVAGFAVHDHAAATTVSTTDAVTTSPTTTPSLDQFDDQLGATPAFGGTAPDSTSRGS
jgi:hypothetical protein